MNRLAVLLGIVWLRKWWILLPTVLTALITSVASHYLLRTRSEDAAANRVMVVGAIGEDEPRIGSRRAGGRLQINGPMSVSSLERLIADLDLSDRDIDVDLIAHDAQGGDIHAQGTVRLFNGSKQGRAR